MTITFYAYAGKGLSGSLRLGPLYYTTVRAARFPFGRFVTEADTPRALRARPRRVLAVGREGSRIAVHLS